MVGHRWQWRRSRPIYETRDKQRVALVESDPAIVEALTADHEATLAYVRQPVGETTAPINSYFALVQDDPSIQIVTNAQVWYVKRLLQGTAYENLPVLSAGAPFKAGGRGGAEYYTDIPTGQIAIRNAADLYLYPNTVRAVVLTGAQVREWLEASASAFNRIDPDKPGEQALLNPSFPSYNFDVIDGVTYRIDVSRPARYDGDGKVVGPNSHRIRDLAYAGKPIDEAQKFVVVTNNYRAGGGGKFPGLDGSNIIVEAPDENRTALVNYIFDQKTINPTSDGNWSLSPIGGVAEVTFLSSPKARDAIPDGAGSAIWGTAATALGNTGSTCRSERQRSRANSYSATAAALETFRLPIGPLVGSRAISSHRSMVRRRRPLPSAPRTRATRLWKVIWASVRLAQLVQADAPVASFPQLGQGAGEIDDPDQGHHLGGAGSAFRQHAGHFRSVAVGQHHGAGAEGGGGAKDGADIVRIGDLIQQHDDVAVLQRTLADDVVQIDLGQGGGVEHQALVHGSGRKQAVEVGPLDQSRRGAVDFRGLGLLDRRGEAASAASVASRRCTRRSGLSRPPRRDEARTAGLDGRIALVPASGGVGAGQTEEDGRGG